MEQRIKTPKEVKQEFEKAGVSIGSWARLNGFKRADVYAVLDGRNKASYGRAHVIAVALGLKHGVVTKVENFYPVPRQEAA